MKSKWQKLIKELIEDGYEVQPRKYTFQMILKKGNTTVKIG